MSAAFVACPFGEGLPLLPRDGTTGGPKTAGEGCDRPTDEERRGAGSKRTGEERKLVGGQQACLRRRGGDQPIAWNALRCASYQAALGLGDGSWYLQTDRNENRMEFKGPGGKALEAGTCWERKKKKDMGGMSDTGASTQAGIGCIHEETHFDLFWEPRDGCGR